MPTEGELNELVKRVTASISGQNWTDKELTEGEKDVIGLTVLYMINTRREEFLPGDLVYLKSGSPKLVVVTVHDDHCHVIGHQYGTSQFIERNVPTVALRRHV